MCAHIFFPWHATTLRADKDLSNSVREGADGVRRGDEQEEEMETAPHKATIEIVNCCLFLFPQLWPSVCTVKPKMNIYRSARSIILRHIFFPVFLSFSTLFPLICPLHFFKISFISAPFPPSLLCLFDYECVRWVGEWVPLLLKRPTDCCTTSWKRASISRGEGRQLHSSPAAVILSPQTLKL